VLVAEVHVGGREVVAELFLGAGRDQRDDRAGLLPHPRDGDLRGGAADFLGDGDDLADTKAPDGLLLFTRPGAGG